MTNKIKFFKKINSVSSPTVSDDGVYFVKPVGGSSRFNMEIIDSGIKYNFNALDYSHPVANITSSDIDKWNLGNDSYPLMSGNDITDYNEVKKMGRYSITSDALQQAMLNKPSNYSGVLEVTFSDNTTWIFQRFTEYFGTQNVYHRRFYNGGWSDWVLSHNNLNFDFNNKSSEHAVLQNLNNSLETGKPYHQVERGFSWINGTVENFGQFNSATGSFISFGNSGHKGQLLVNKTGILFRGIYGDNDNPNWLSVWHDGNFNPDTKANTSGNYPELTVGSANLWSGHKYIGIQLTTSPYWVMTYDTVDEAWKPAGANVISDWMRTSMMVVNPAGLKEATYGNWYGIVQEESSDNPTYSWYNKLKILHNNSYGYSTELAQSFGSEGIFYRSTVQQTSNWTKLWDKNDFNDTRVSNWDSAYNSIGFPLSNLQTSDKTSLVGAVNEAYTRWTTKSVDNLDHVINNGFYRQENPTNAFPYSATLNLNSIDGRQQLQIDRDGNGMRFRSSRYNNGADWSEWKSVKTGHTRTVIVNNLSANKFVGLRFAKFNIGPCKVVVTVQGNYNYSNIGGSALVKEYCFHDNGDKDFHSQSSRSISAYGPIAEAYRLSDGVYWNGSGEISCNLHGLPAASSGNPLKITIDYYLCVERNFEYISPWVTEELDDTSGIRKDKELALNDGSNTTGGTWNIDMINSARLEAAVGNSQIFNSTGNAIWWGNISVQTHTFEANNPDALGFYVPGRGRAYIWHGHNFNPDLKVNQNGDNVTPNSEWNIYSKGIYGALDSDFWRIQGNLVSSNNIELELATADDATEAIVARQYGGPFTTKVREAYILDGAGNTSFPGTVTAQSFRMNGTTTTPIGVVSTESSIWQLGGDYAYGISMNQHGGFDIMANQSGQPIRLWSGGTNASPYKTMELNGSGVSVYGTIFTLNHGDSSQWKQAYNWGNHALAGYLTSANVGNFFEKESINTSSNVNSFALGLFTVVPTTLNLPTATYGIVSCYKANTTWWFQQFKTTEGVIWERRAINPTNVDSWQPWVKINANSSIDNYVDKTSEQVITGRKIFNVQISAPSFLNTSLRKYKKNIKKFTDSGLDLIDSLEIVTFDRKDTKEKNVIGVIADDIKQEFLSEDCDAVDLYKTIFIQAKAIQELNNKVNKLEELVNKMLGN